MTSSSSDRARRRAVRTPHSRDRPVVHHRGPRPGATGPTTALIDSTLLVPYPDETGVDFTALGWRVLPADASPQEKARAEVSWLPGIASRHCRCSGPCHHNHSCSDLAPGFACTGWLIHLSRRPELAELELEPITWSDRYRCNECAA